MVDLKGRLERVTFDTESGRKDRPYRVTITFAEGDLQWRDLVALATAEIKRVHARRVGRGWSSAKLERTLRESGGAMTIAWADLVGRTQQQAGLAPAELLAQVMSVSPLARHQAWSLAMGWGMSPQAFEAWWRSQSKPEPEPEPELPSSSPWFEGCGSADEVRERYRRLAKVYHPDRGGTNGQMTEINREFERAKARFGLA